MKLWQQTLGLYLDPPGRCGAFLNMSLIASSISHSLAFLYSLAAAPVYKLKQ